jgi:hypothetical protein
VEQRKGTLILDGLQAILERWTNEQLLGRRAISTTMRHNRGLIGSGEGVRSPLETGWASFSAVSMPTSGICGATESITAIFAD